MYLLNLIKFKYRVDGVPFFQDTHSGRSAEDEG
jgi:hypothetical protein